MLRQQHNGSKDARAVPWQFRGNLAGKGSTGGGHGNGASHEVEGGRDGSCEIVPVGLIRTMKKIDFEKSQCLTKTNLVVDSGQECYDEDEMGGNGKTLFFRRDVLCEKGA